MDRSVPAQCNNCAHNNFDGSCKAYKGGIPIVILSNQLDHRQPIQGDNGYLWTLADDASYPEHPNDRAFFEKYIFPDIGETFDPDDRQAESARRADETDKKRKR
jgi:hypothetical protein